MSEGKRTIREQADEIRRELDDLIGEDINIGVERDPGDVIPPNRALSPAVNYAELKDQASSKAKKTIGSLLRFYLDADIIERDEYVKAKRRMDEMTMSSLIYQLQAGERALTILVEAIEDGDIQPRMFEVLGTLQKSMLDIIKSQTMYLMAAEESTKRIARDIEIYQRRDDKRAIEESGGDTSNVNIQRGTKDLMAAIQAGIKMEQNGDDDIQDVEISDEL